MRIYTKLGMLIQHVRVIYRTHERKVYFYQYDDQFLARCMECRRGLAMRILSVRPSVTRVDCDKTAERSVQICIPYERTFSLVF